MIIVNVESYAQAKALINAFPQRNVVVYSLGSPANLRRVAVYSAGVPVFVWDFASLVDETTFKTDFPEALKVGFINLAEVL